MAYAVVLDADVLHPYNLADLLLRLCERGLFRVAWSEELIDELVDSLVRRGLERPRARRRVEAMSQAFPEALVAGVGRFLTAVPNEIEPDDRHVVAAALAAKADCVVTNNTRHFPPDALVALGLDVQSADEFLVNQLTLDAEAVVGVIREMEADRRKPPRTPHELLAALEGVAPRFAELARELFDDD